MKTIVKIATISLVLALMFIADIPLLPVNLVPEAHAILGVRRRTAVVAYSAGAASASAAAASSQQQAAEAEQEAAAAQQQAAAAQQQTAAAKASSGVPVGTVVQSLPAGCTAVTVSGVQFQDCGGSFYKAAFQGNNLVYVVVEKPI
jgi:hypothetical protein